MPRQVSSDFMRILNAPIKNVVLFYEGELKEGPLRLWTGTYEITYDSKLWVGAGTLLSLSSIDESSNLQASGLGISITGIPADVLEKSIGEFYQGQKCKIFFGFIDENNTIIADPSLAFNGLLDNVNFSDDEDSFTIIVNYENKLRDLERIRELRYTSESQKMLYPNDVGFDYVPSLQDWNEKWGKF